MIDDPTPERAIPEQPGRDDPKFGDPLNTLFPVVAFNQWWSFLSRNTGRFGTVGMRMGG
jgi:hypothetical protein